MEFDRVIPTTKRIERLQYENPWWNTGTIQQVYRDMSRRLYFNVFFPYVSDTSIKRAVVLMGPRRVGKTIMMLHAIQQLLDNAMPRQKICLRT